jgi:hypothetical protein
MLFLYTNTEFTAYIYVYILVSKCCLSLDTISSGVELFVIMPSAFIFCTFMHYWHYGVRMRSLWLWPLTTRSNNRFFSLLLSFFIFNRTGKYWCHFVLDLQVKYNVIDFFYHTKLLEVLLFCLKAECLCVMYVHVDAWVHGRVSLIRMKLPWHILVHKKH